MSPVQISYLVFVPLAVVCSAVGLVVRRGQRTWALVTVVLLAVPLLWAWVRAGDHAAGTGAHAVALAAGVLAVVGGGLVTTQVLATVEGGAVRPAGDVLRGGAWIGALERLAVFATLIAGWGPGLAIVLAVKGLGRYPELRNQEDTGAAERFIIGTFTSVLWAAGCAGLAILAP
ncbi:MAG: hypothetical protein WAV00_11605 [Nocardioides sp.]